jgi:hypothetical protein
VVKRLVDGHHLIYTANDGVYSLKFHLPAYLKSEKARVGHMKYIPIVEDKPQPVNFLKRSVVATGGIRYIKTRRKLFYI